MGIRGISKPEAKLVFTTDTTNPAFHDNIIPDTKVEDNVRYFRNNEIENLNKMKKRSSIMVKTNNNNLGRKETKQKKQDEFEKIIKYIWTHDKKCTTEDIHKLLFGPTDTEIVNTKFCDNRMQDLKWASHIGKDFLDQKFIIQRSSAGGWRILPGYDSSMIELIDYCKLHSNNRGRAVVFKKENGASVQYKPRKKSTDDKSIKSSTTENTFAIGDVLESIRMVMTNLPATWKEMDIHIKPPEISINVKR